MEKRKPKRFGKSDDVLKGLKVVILAFFLHGIIACEKESPISQGYSHITDSVEVYGDPSRGLDVYRTKLDHNGRACMHCHLSPEGSDIVRFGKLDIHSQDSIVVFRALEHVPKQEAYDIAAYLKSLPIQARGNVPVGEILGITNTGSDPMSVWNGSTSLTISEIESWNFKTGMRYSFSSPKWFEGDGTNLLPTENLDWLPELDLISEKGGEVATTYAAYVQSPTKENLKAVLQAGHEALSEGERHPGEHGYFDFNRAFDFQRWLATLYMQHVINPDSDLEFGEEISGYAVKDFSLADGIWDAGNVARRSQDNGRSPNDEIDNRLLNEVQWLYLGWLTNYGERNSFESQYIGTALKEYNHQDLASLVILKSMISRSPNSVRRYDDVFTMGYITSDALFYESVAFGLEHLIEGILHGNGDFQLLNSDEIQNTLSNLKNSVSPIPDLYQFVTEKTFLSQTQSNDLHAKIDSVYTLVEAM